MSKLMWILGILLVAVGLALGLLTIFSPGKMDILGLKADTAAILLVGGILTIGVGAIIDTLRTYLSVKVSANARAAVDDVIEAPAAAPNPARFGRKPAEVAAATAAAATVETVSATSAKAVDVGKTSVADTIAALDEAKADIKKALVGMDAITTPEEAVETVATPASAVAEVAADLEPEGPEDVESELYVVEEKIIRGRPARVLSDDTVEAETDEGWMRFENLDHLNEYLDSVEEQES